MEDGSPIQANLYDTDLTAWAEQQAAALRARAGGGNALDYDNLAEEIDDVAGSLLRSCRSYLAVIIEHLLKLQFTLSTRDERGWKQSVRAARGDLEEDLSPTLRSRLPDQMPNFFDTRLKRLRDNDLGLNIDTIRQALPNGYSWEQLTSDDWWPVPAREEKPSESGCRISPSPRSPPSGTA